MSNLRDTQYRIWVISDTHLRSRAILPRAFTRRVNREDIVIHLGDFVSLELAEYLQSICRLEAVYGNCDPPLIRERFPVKKILELSGKKIGLTHGRGSLSETIHRVREEFEGKVDIALFGHTLSSLGILGSVSQLRPLGIRPPEGLLVDPR